VVSGSSAALQSYEPSFHQDLNGDGTIGAASATNPALLANYMASAFTASAGQAAAVGPAPPSPDRELLATPMTAN
jgi:serralysin